MPMYEYACRGCKQSFDHLARSVSDRDVSVPCPACGSGDTHRALSLVAVHADGGSRADPAPSMCGCGKIPGSCGR